MIIINVSYIPLNSNWNIFCGLSFYAIAKNDFGSVHLLADMIKASDSYLDALFVSAQTFGCMFFVTFSISNGIKAIYEIILFHYYGLFYKEREIHMNVDENNVIRDSYVKLRSGKISPINIHKITFGKLEENVTEETEGNEQ